MAKSEYAHTERLSNIERELKDLRRTQARNAELVITQREAIVSLTAAVAELAGPRQADLALALAKMSGRPYSE